MMRLAKLGIYTLWVINIAYGIAHYVSPEMWGGLDTAQRLLLTLTGVLHLAYIFRFRTDEYHIGYNQGRIDSHRDRN
ncbi:hypothetical protein [Streptosporangium sp. NPDC006930]|uniref:hypothetical protein n=1 Tax=Streptosporangium sp. NPDC006930 TaxID=3154783 RepID=UPI0034335156